MLCPFFSASSVGNKKQNPFPHRHLFIVIIGFLFFKFRLAGKFNAQFAEFPDIYGRQHNRCMGLATF